MSFVKVDRTDCEIITFEVQIIFFFLLCLAGTASIDYTDCEIITFEVQRKVFFHYAWQEQQTLTTLGTKIWNYANLSFCTIVMHIMIGTCVPNLKGRG